MIRAVGFDIGETLTCHNGIPLSWQSLYRDALTCVAESCLFAPSGTAIENAEAILARYNTRLNPRTIEVPSAEIFTAILNEWDLAPERWLDAATDAFFSFFRQDVTIYDDAVPLLQHLKSNDIRIGALTDVPYGMEKRFVEQDIEPIARYFDVVLTSVEVGYRKPDPKGYIELAARLGVKPREMAYIGNEPKDITGARNAGILSILIDRDGSAPTCGEGIKLGSLTELLGLPRFRF